MRLKIFLLMILALTISGCGGSGGTVNTENTNSNNTTDNNNTTQPTGFAEYLNAVPSSYFTQCTEKGTIITEHYKSRDYTNNQEITKTAYIYLPYGYSESERYDVFYLMHGWTMTAGSFFSDCDLPDMLDNMIHDGLIKPLIVVCVTFDAQNQPQSFSRSQEELLVFHNDFRNDLLPYIESKYSTFAENTTPEGLRNSRTHRAFGGFSLGAVTTWHQFIYNLDLMKFFLPMSGDCWIIGTYGGRYYPDETTEYLEGVVRSGNWRDDDFYIYEGIGTDDPIFTQTDNQIQAMMKTQTFTPSNLHYAIIDGGRHDLIACETYMYHALRIFFGR